MSISKRYIYNFQTGAALVEFAIILPLLLLLVLGISELSFAFFHLNILNKSVQDAALYFSNLARCKSSTDCSPNYLINVSSTNSSNYNTAVNLVKTGNYALCNDTTNPSLMPLCANYSAVDITMFDANHVQVMATYQHSFMTGNALNNLVKVMFSPSSTFANSYNLTATSVMRAQ